MEDTVMTPKQVLDMAKENGVKVVDIRFMDFPGVWQHFSVPIGELEESSFDDGYGFDGSSIRGWQPINMSDMLVVPDATTAKIDPFFEIPTMVLIGNIVDPITREPYTRDPRNIARKAEAFLTSTGIGDTVFIGPEAEFLFLTASGLNLLPTSLSMRWILLREFGIPPEKRPPTWDTNPDTKKDIFRFRRWINFRISGLK